jgi:hypothetical protein
MANLGICRKCSNCRSFSPAVVNDRDVKIQLTFIECGLSVGEPMGWDDEIPDGCPYMLEHKLTEDAVSDFDKEDDDAT